MIKFSTLVASASVATAFSVGVQAQDQKPPVANQKPATVTEQLSAAVQSVTGNPLAKADADMKRVLDAHAELDPKPIEKLSPTEARKQPSPADAVKAVLKKEGKSTEPLPGVTATDTTYKGAAGEVAARVYKPEGASGALPVILYFHGGGFVIADLDTYDATPRSFAKLANAVVISAHYRQAPEHKFPAAHEDAIAAYKWVLENAEAQGGDPKRIILMGESAGGNLAFNVAMAARDQSLQAPLHQVIVYPIAGVDMNTASYTENESAKPLNKAMMAWFMEQTLAKPDDKASPMLDVNGKAKLDGLPPTTIVTADIDPLRSDGESLAKKLAAAGVETEHRNYEGAAHEFFGMATVVKDAADAQSYVASRLKSVIGQKGASAE